MSLYCLNDATLTLLVFGIIRIEIEQVHKINIPTSIKQEIIKFCKNSFEFDQTRHGQFLLFKSPIQVMVKKNGIRMPNICVSKDIISSKVYDMFDFEITINETGKKKPSNNVYINIYVGWVNPPITKSISLWDGPSTYLGSKTRNIGNTFGVRIANDKIQSVGDFKAINDQYYTFKDGDKMKLSFDFKHRILNVYYNDKFVGKAFDNIPDEIVPAISLSTVFSEVTVTKANAYKL